MEHAEAWAMVETMARMQESYNCEVHPDWRNQGYPFYRAVWVECAELLDHYGWKWWKHQRPDLEQVKLEIVDIWVDLAMQLEGDDLRRMDCLARVQQKKRVKA